MKLTKSTVAATLAALLIGGLAISPASAAVRRDLNSVTHGSIQEQANPFGPVKGKRYSRSDIAAVTHKASASSGRLEGNQFSWSDISAVTQN